MSCDWGMILQSLGQTPPYSTHPVSGGDINQCYRLQVGGQSYFVKCNAAHRLAMFEAEYAGLTQLAQTQTIRVPQPLAVGVAASQSFLVLGWLDLSSARADWAALGRALARLHQTPVGEQFGWLADNTIGTTPQPNPLTGDWITFWREARLGHQLKLAQVNLAGAQELLRVLPQFFQSYTPTPTLVHGDLWGGNAGFLTTGEPVIYDPAPYWGDREVDLAMTELFGGFPPAFYRAYQATYPLDPGYATRKNLYNLYHVLNHFNLFGGGYRGQAERMIGQLLRA